MFIMVQMSKMQYNSYICKPCWNGKCSLVFFFFFIEMCLFLTWIVPLCLLCVCSVPDDLSLKVYRVEANWAMMRFPDALTDIDYLCCLRPNWTEVRVAHSRDIQCLELPVHFSSPLCKSLLNLT